MLLQSALSLAFGFASFASTAEASRSRPRHHKQPLHHSEARGNGQGEAYNPNHPHRDLAKRSTTADPSGIKGLSYDYIIVGGGVAGLTLAARLSDTANQTVLVIEAGGDGSDVVLNQQIPGYTYHHGIASNTPYGWNYTTVPQTGADSAIRHYPLGRGLGGSGAINGMFWCRGSKDEYDAWGELNPNGNQTWNWDEMNKYIKKAENLQMPPQETIDKFHMPINPSAHGSGGPLQVGWPQYLFPPIENWVPTWTGLGFPAHDLAEGKTRGAMLTPSTIDASKQARSDSKNAYLDPSDGRPNLTVLTKHQGISLIFNGTKDDYGKLLVGGVKFQADPSSPVYEAYSIKEVIVSSGTINSPKLLQLSGIGPDNVLKAAGVKTLIDLPVGHNFHDHMSYAMFWDTVEGLETWFALGASEELKAQALAEYEASKTGLWTYINDAVAYASMPDLAGGQDAAAAMANGLDIGATVAALASKYNMPSTVQAGITEQYKIQQRWLTTDVGQLEYIMHLWGKSPNSLGIQVCLQHAFARGTMFISSPDPFAMPNIDPNYFGVDIDGQIMNAAVNWIRNFAKSPPMSNIMVNEAIPGANYTDDALIGLLKTVASTEYHPLGSCAMLPQDKGGVVDTNLIVYGTANLRVVDASIMPLHQSAHLMAPTYGVAEKAADIIKDRHKWRASVVVASTSSSASKTSGSTKSTSATSSSSTTGAAMKNEASSSALSLPAKIGVGVGVALGVILLLGAIIFFCMKRNKEQPAAAKNGWYAQGAAQGQWAGASNFAGQESYPMVNQDGLRGRPMSHGSIDTMATADLPRPGNRY